MSFSAVLPARWRWYILLLLVGWLAWTGSAWWLFRQPFRLSTYLGGLGWTLLGGILAYLTYHFWALVRLRYTITRDGIYVRWGWQQFFMPMNEIQKVTDMLSSARPFWWRWPALYVGSSQIAGRPIHAFSSVPWHQALVLTGPRVIFIISPQTPAAFIEALNARRALGPNRRRPLGWERPRWARWALWRDAPALSALVTVGVTTLLLWGEAAGRVDNARLLHLVQLASFLLAGNTLLGFLVYARERMAALALWWGGAGILLVFLLGLWTGYLIS